MTEFNVGDNVTVTATGAETEIAYGPYRLFNGADLYFTTDSEPRTADQLSPAPVDPRREVVAKAMQRRDENGERDWEDVSEAGQKLYLADADAVLAALDAHDSEQQSTLDEANARIRAVYGSPAASAPARYRDRDGDVWEENSDGTLTLVVGRTAGDEFYNNRQLNLVQQSYGPLTRV